MNLSDDDPPENNWFGHRAHLPRPDATSRPDLVPLLLDVSIDPCDGSVHPTLQYVLIRGFSAMGWEQPKAASEDMAMEILKMIRPSKTDSSAPGPAAWRAKYHGDPRWTYLHKPPSPGAWDEAQPLYTIPGPSSEALVAALHAIIALDHHNMGPESQATKLARAALSQARA